MNYEPLLASSRKCMPMPMPLEWKAATVTPLYKNGDKNDPSNYRPISILPVVAKLCERVICTQLMTFLKSHCILCPQQYGFRLGLSTEAAVRGEKNSKAVADAGGSCLTTEKGRSERRSVEHTFVVSSYH